MICMECDNKERNHPSFEEDRNKELEERMECNFNYAGINKPQKL